MQSEDYVLDAEIFRNPFLRTHMKCMRLYGLIIGTDQKYAWWHKARYIFFSLSIFFSGALIFMKMSRNLQNVQDGAPSWATGFLYLSMTMVAINVSMQKSRFLNILRFVHKDIKRFLRGADTCELVYYNSAVHYVRVMTIGLLILSIMAGSIASSDCIVRTIFQPEAVFNIPQVLNGTAQPVLLFKLFPFGEIYDNFLVSYVGAFWAIFLGVMAVPIWHTFVASLMKYVILKFEVINQRLCRMDISKVTDRDVAEMSDWEVNYWRYQLCRLCIQEQTKIRWFIGELQALIRVPVFLDFMIFSFLICLLLYALTTGNPSRMVQCFIGLYLFVMAAVQWLYHWHATLVTEGNNGMSFAIYSCDWYNYPLHLQKTIHLIMIGATSPLDISALLVRLNLRTFIDLVRCTYSYFNILRSTSAN